MKKLLLSFGALSLLATAPMAEAAVSNYNVTTTWYEPETQPRDSIFQGTFTYDSATHTISNLQGLLSESMTGTNASDMTWLTLSNQLATWYDAALGGTFAAAFKNTTTATFYSGTWKPEDGVAVLGTYAGYVSPFNPGVNANNAYALIFVPDSPLTALTAGQLSKLAYADCAPGGMMGSTCMTGTSLAGYGAIGTMSGVPYSQTITAAVPEPETYAMMMAGLGLVGWMSRRRKSQVVAA
jgi:hypothetical protein